MKTNFLSVPIVHSWSHQNAMNYQLPAWKNLAGNTAARNFLSVYPRFQAPMLRSFHLPNQKSGTYLIVRNHACQSHLKGQSPITFFIPSLHHITVSEIKRFGLIIDTQCLLVIADDIQKGNPLALFPQQLLILSILCLAYPNLESQ